MSFEWEDFKTLAFELCDRSDDEASQRTAISRFYYAAFCRLRDYIILTDKHEFKKDSNIHTEVIKYLINEHRYIAEYGKIGRKLRRLRKNRNIADYESDMENKETLIIESKKHSDYIFKNINNLKEEI
jgi:uncharacterized protein (UPF0332 family)